MSKASKRERQRLNREARRELEERLQKRRKNIRTARRAAIFGSPVLIVVIILAVTGGGGSSSSSTSRTFKAAPPLTIVPTHSYTATVNTTKGPIVIALAVKTAPKSVNNFVFLARKHFYDGLLFNRASKNFVIQTGSPDNSQAGGPGYSAPAEVPTTAYTVGSVAWAKTSSDPAGTAGSQFFIGTGPQMTTLPRDYGIIGSVTQGLAVAQQIEALAPASGDGALRTKVRMVKVTITETATPPTS